MPAVNIVWRRSFCVASLLQSQVGIAFAFLPLPSDIYSRPILKPALAALSAVDQEYLTTGSRSTQIAPMDETDMVPFQQLKVVSAQVADKVVSFPDSDFLKKEPQPPAAGREGEEIFFKMTPQPLYQELNARSFPLSMIVGQDLVKQGLLMSAVNQHGIKSIVISGGRGTGKSVMARAIHQLLPPIEVIKGSPFNIDPNGEFGLDDFTRADLEKNDAIPLNERETQRIPCPFVQVPLNVMDDRLIGSTDIEESVKLGKTVFSPGLLARAHRGVLYVDDINLLDEEIVNILLNVITDGYVTVEREGVSLRYPCRPLLIATFNPEEGELRDCLLDCIAISVSADAHKLSVQERVEACERCIDYSGSGPQKSIKGEHVFEEAMRVETDLQRAIILAREKIKDVALSRPQMQYLCEEAIRAGCEGHRAEIFAVEVARASAAIKGRQVTSDDLRLAVKLAIAPRGKFFLLPGPPPPPPPPMPPQLDEQENDQDKSEEEEKEEEKDEPDTDDGKDEADGGPDVPPQFMFDADTTPMDPELIAFANRVRAGKGRGRSRIFSQDRGRFIKAIFPHGKAGRIAIAATMRACAPHQKSRRARAIGTKYQSRVVHIEDSDVRIKKMARKAGSLVIFVVDASGSMALNRMNAAKGAAISLLAEAYKSRDKISLICFRERQADVLLPPTKSTALAKKRLEQLPCGGNSPLAHALQSAILTGINAQKSRDVGKVVVVLISDGRANVPVCVSMGEEFDPSADDNSQDGKPSRKYLKEEVLALSKKLGSLPNFNLLCVDTENKFVSTGLLKDIADAARGKYHQIQADHRTIAQVTNQALNEAML